jgi:uncharacterized repeat protein (TIGR03847 family)
MIDFGFVDAIDAEAIGQPGERTFRLRARVGDSYASLWMEKEQLSALGRGFSQILAERSMQRGEPVDPVEEFGAFPANPQVDFRIARLGLDFDHDNEHIVLLADDEGAVERGDSPTFRMEISRRQALPVISQAERLVAAGRPLCPLCKRPLEEEGAEHFCPPTNGHSTELPVPERQSDEE